MARWNASVFREPPGPVLPTNIRLTVFTPEFRPAVTVRVCYAANAVLYTPVAYIPNVGCGAEDFFTHVP